MVREAEEAEVHGPGGKKDLGLKTEGPVRGDESVSERGTSALVWLGRELASHSRCSVKGFPMQQICVHFKISSVLEQGEERGDQ